MTTPRRWKVPRERRLLPLPQVVPAPRGVTAASQSGSSSPASCDTRSLLGAQNDLLQHFTITVERIVHYGDRWDLQIAWRKCLRIKPLETGFVHAARPTPRRGTTQVLKSPGVLVEGWRIRTFGKDLVDGDEGHERIVMHLAAREHLRALAPQLPHQASRSF